MFSNGQNSIIKTKLTDNFGPGRIKSRGLFKFDLQLFAVDYASYSLKFLESCIKKNTKRIEEHKNKIAFPEKYVKDWKTRDERYKNGLIKHWKKEIQNFENQILMAQTEQKRRGLL